MKKNFIYLLLFLAFFMACETKEIQNAQEINQKGLEYLNQRKYPEAIACFLKASQAKGISTKEKIEFLRNAAIVYGECQMYDSARFYYSMAADISPANSYYQNVNKADVLLLDGNCSLAVECLENALKMDKNELSVYNMLGLIYLGEYDSTFFNPEQALTYNKKAYELNKDRNTKFVLAKNYYLLSDLEKSELHMRELYESFSDDLMYLESYIVILGEMGNFQKRLDLLEELKEKDMDRYLVLTDSTGY